MYACMHVCMYIYIKYKRKQDQNTIKNNKCLMLWYAVNQTDEEEQTSQLC